MKKIFLLMILVPFMALMGVSQSIHGKKLLKQVNVLQKNGQDKEAINLIHSNVNNNGKMQSLIVLELAKLQYKVLLVDSAKLTMQELEKLPHEKIQREMDKWNKKISQNKEEYEVAVAIAHKRIQENDLGGARESYNEALMLDVGNYKAWFGLADIDAISMHHKEAIAGFRKTLKMYFDDTHEKVHAYEHLAEEHLALRQPKEAIQVCDLAIVLDPGNAELVYLKGKGLYLQRDFKAAIRVFSESVLMDNENTSAFFFRGSSYHETKEYQLAIEDFTTVLRREEMILEAYYQRANSYYEFEKYDLAEQDFESMVALEKDHFYAINAVGLCAYKLENYPKAVEMFSQTLQVIGKDSMTINTSNYKYNLGMAYYKNKQLDEALSVFESLALKNRSTATYNVIHTRILMNKGDYKSAKAWMAESIKLSTNVKEYHEVMKEIELHEGNKLAAEEQDYLKSIIRGDTRSFELFF